MSCTDALRAACALVALTAPSRLACDQARAAGHVPPLSGMERVPCDTPRRARLAPVSPKGLRPGGTRIVRHLQRGPAREPMGWLDGPSLRARDGTAACASQTRPCAACLRNVHRHGAIPSGPQMLGAARRPPDPRAVRPLMPEPMVNPDGTATQAGARNAATRGLAKGRTAHPHRRLIVTADSLRAHAPHRETLHAHGRHALRGGKEGQPPLVFAPVQAAEHAGPVPEDARHARAAGGTHRCHVVHERALNASTPPMRVNGMESWEIGPHKVQHGRWGTDLRVCTRNGYHLMRGGGRGGRSHTRPSRR